MANADQLLIFRRSGQNDVPVAHPTGIHRYAGEEQMPSDLLPLKGMTGDQKKNRFSHWIWRRYADAFWDDIRIDHVLPYRHVTEADDEKHCHPLQLDVIERACVLWSNPSEVVLTPFLGVGSEAYGAILNGRKAIGIELKTAYFNQAVKNCEAAAKGHVAEEVPLFAQMEDDV
jgi:DNA modification methylase